MQRFIIQQKNGNALQGMSGFGTEVLRAGMHGITQGGLEPYKAIISLMDLPVVR
jgi:hypothetical protein